MVTPSRSTISPGTVSSQFPPASAATSTTTDPGRMRVTAAAGIRRGAGRPGTSAVVITASKSGIRSSSAACWLACSSDGELPRVAAGRLLAADAEVEEGRAEALDLLLHHGPHVERRHDRAQPPRGRDRLQAGHAGAEDEHLRRGHGAGGRHQEREELLQPVGGEQRRLVARHRALRGERVHRLSARDARDRLHRERDDAAAREPLDAGRVRER